MLLAKGDTKKAIDVLEHLDQTYPDAPLIKYQLASAYLRNNSPNQAKVALEQAISINPNFADAIVLLAEINIRSGHGEMAIEPITNLLRKRPDLRSAAFLLAAVYGTLDRFDDAEAVIRNQVRLAPQDPQPHTALGLIFRQAKRNDEARQAFEEADDALGYKLSRLCFEGPEDQLRLTEITQPVTARAQTYFRPDGSITNW